MTTLLLVGAYGPGAPGSPGGRVHVLEYDGKAVGAAADPLELPAPSYLAPHPLLPVVYAVGETDPHGSVTALDVSAGFATPRPIGGRDLEGAEPCHALVHPSGRWLLVAEYGSGSMSVFGLERDGALGALADHVRFDGSGPVADRQGAAHVHQVSVDPRDGSVRAVDLGSDRVHRLALGQESGRLTALDDRRQAPGNGPRHLADHRAGWTFVSNELGGTVGRWDAAETVPTTAGTGQNLPSGLALSPDDRFLYVGNRGSNTLATFTVGPHGALTRTAETETGGDWPRQFAVHGEQGKHVFVANQYSGTVTVLTRDPRDGSLTRTDAVADAPGASCVLPLN